MQCCEIAGCDRPVRSRGLCQTHARRRQAGEVDWQRPIAAPWTPHCSLDGCGRPTYAAGLCRRHWTRRQAGEVDWQRPIQRQRSRAERVHRTSAQMKSRWQRAVRATQGCPRPVVRGGYCHACSQVRWQRQAAARRRTRPLARKLRRLPTAAYRGRWQRALRRAK